MLWQPGSGENQHDKTHAPTEAALEPSSDDPSVTIRLCGALLRQRRTRDAAAIMTAAVEREPANCEYRVLLARTHLALADIGEAQRQIAQALRLAPENRNALLLHFNVLVRTRQWAAADDLAPQISILDPLNANLARSRLRADAPRSSWQAQLDVCEGQLASDPFRAAAVLFKAVALTRLGRAREAKEAMDLDRFLTIDALGGFEDAQTFRTGLAQEIKDNPSLSPDEKTTRNGLQTRQLRGPGATHVETLLQQIAADVDRYEARLEGATDFARARPRAAKLSAWAVIYGALGHQQPHYHPKGWLSGVFYVSASRRDGAFAGPLVLGPLPQWFGIADPPWGTREIEPVPGRIVMFPSYIPHCTRQTDVEGVRISVAFDVEAATKDLARAPAMMPSGMA